MLSLPFLALFPFAPPQPSTALALSCPFHTLTPPPSFRDPNVLGNGISWSLLNLTGHVLPSPHTHTLSLHPALVRSLEVKQKRPCFFHCPFGSRSTPLPAPPTPVHSALSRGECTVQSVQTVWWCQGFPLILHCFLHFPPNLPICPPPPS